MSFAIIIQKEFALQFDTNPGVMRVALGWVVIVATLVNIENVSVAQERHIGILHAFLGSILGHPGIADISEQDKRISTTEEGIIFDDHDANVIVCHSVIEPWDLEEAA